MTIEARRCRAAVLALLALAVTPRIGAAQVSGAIETLAPVLAAEDARAWDAAAFRAGLTSPDSTVRSAAALAVGRLGDSRGLPLLLPVLVDVDSTVRVSAVFALGLMHDTAAVTPLIERLRTPPALDTPSARETIAALARIGGRRAADFLAGVLQNREPLQYVARPPLVEEIALQAWRLGRAAPVADLLPLATDSSEILRMNAVYSLVRLRAPSAGDRLIAAVRDQSASVRAAAVRGMTRSYADSAHLAPESVADLAAHAADDADASVRVNALRSLGTFHLPKYSARITGRLGDQQPNVRVQTAMTLGQLGGADAIAALTRTLAGKEAFAVAAEALRSLARLDSAAARGPIAAWQGSAEWRDRAVAAEASHIASGSVAGFLKDPDPRVIAAALQAWTGTGGPATPEMLASARTLLSSPDAAVRSLCADVLARAHDVADLPALADAYRASARDSFPEAALSALGALAAIARSSDAARARVENEFLDRTPKPANYLLRRWAAESWPAAARRWGPAYPVVTGRTLQDYRDIARRYVFAPYATSHPHVTIETPDRGNIELELLGPDAPLTVVNFLSLVDRHYFDGNRWHRVVPDFVVQDGDRRGDGWGSPGGAIRDEINPIRYEAPVLGMALSGPDTGSGQWFINLSRQPHLDGIYTVFGRVVSGVGPLYRITQGDLIRTIRR